MMTNQQYRYKLLKTFWYAVKEAGMTEEDARAFAWSKQAKRISQLTIDELEAVTKELIEVHSLDVGMPKRKRQRVPPSVNIYQTFEAATLDQLEVIEGYAKAVGLNDNALLKILRRMGYTVGSIPLVVAQKTIECLKAMSKRGWRATRQAEERIPEKVIWN